MGERPSIPLMLVILSLGVLAACAAGEERVPALPKVANVEGEGTPLQRFDVRQGSKSVVVRVFNRGGSARTITVSSRAFRGLDRSDGQLALNAAAEAGTEVDCGGQPLRVLGETGRFQEQGRRSAFTSGESAWIFQGQCG